MCIYSCTYIIKTLICIVYSYFIVLHVRKIFDTQYQKRCTVWFVFLAFLSIPSSGGHTRSYRGHVGGRGGSRWRGQVRVKPGSFHFDVTSGVKSRAFSANNNSPNPTRGWIWWTREDIIVDFTNPCVQCNISIVHLLIIQAHIYRSI